MSETVQKPRLINTYDQMKAYGGDRVCISYQPAGTGRNIQVAGWYVIRYRNGVEIPTNKDAAWYDRGRKFFMSGLEQGTPHQRRTAALAKAIAWANAIYGKREYVRNRYGEFVEKDVQRKFPLPKRER